MRIITVILTLKILLGVKIKHLIDMTGLFKISNLDLGGKKIVLSLYSSLEEQRQRQREEPVGREQGLLSVRIRHGNSITYVRVNGDKVFKILTVEPTRD
jgi:hypothetical protein